MNPLEKLFTGKTLYSIILQHKQHNWQYFYIRAYTKIEARKIAINMSGIRPIPKIVILKFYDQSALPHVK